MTVTPAPTQNPTVTAARTPTGNTRVGVPIAFTATGTDPDGDPLTYSWDFGDSTPRRPSRTRRTRSPPPRRSPSRVTVSDGAAAPAPTTLSVVVQANRNPTISAATATPADGHRAADRAVRGDGDRPRRPRGHLRVGPRRRRHVRDHRRRTRRSRYTTARTHDAGAAGHRRLRRLGHAHADRQRVRRRRTTRTRSYNVLVFSKTAGVPPLERSTRRITAIRKLGVAEQLHRRRHRGRLAVHGRVPRPLRRGGLQLDHGRRAQRHPAGRVRALHQGRQRLRRHPLGDRHRVRLAVVRPADGRATSATTRPARRPRRSSCEDATHSSTAHLPARWTRRDEWYNFQGIVNPVVNGGGTDVSPRGQHADPRAADDGRVDLRRVRRHRRHQRRSPDRLVQALRRRPHVLHRAWRTPRPPTWRRTSSSTCTAGSRSRPATRRTPTAASSPTRRRRSRPRGRRAAPSDTGRAGGVHGDRRPMPTATRSRTRGTSATAGRSTQREPDAHVHDGRHLRGQGDGQRRHAAAAPVETLPVTVDVGSAHASGEVGADVGLVLGARDRRRGVLRRHHPGRHEGLRGASPRSSRAPPARPR